MEFLEDGVKLNLEEYAEVMIALQALAALRPTEPSFNTTIPTVEVEPWADSNLTTSSRNTSTNTVSTKMETKMCYV